MKIFYSLVILAITSFFGECIAWIYVFNGLFWAIIWFIACVFLASAISIGFYRDKF